MCRSHSDPAVLSVTPAASPADANVLSTLPASPADANVIPNLEPHDLADLVDVATPVFGMGGGCTLEEVPESPEPHQRSSQGLSGAHYGHFGHFPQNLHSGSQTLSPSIGPPATSATTVSSTSLRRHYGHFSPFRSESLFPR